VKLFKLAWDAVGSEFGSRHLQYGMFYSGSNVVTRGHAFRTYAWEKATGWVDRLMVSYDLPHGKGAAGKMSAGTKESKVGRGAD
jgi:4-hydroxyphenylacetate 3-monooxygenase